MADVEAQSTLSVEVQGEEAINRLAAALASLQSQAAQVQAAVAAAPARVTPAAAQRAVQEVARKGAEEFNTLGARLAYRLSYGVGTGIRTGFDALKAGASVAGRAVAGLAGPLGQVATAGGPAATAVIGVGLAITGLAVPLVSFIAGLKLLRSSFGWAQEAAEEQMRIAGRTRRFYPQMIGEAVEGAEREMEVRMGVASALFGDAADSMQEQITRRFTAFRMGRGLRGERDIFARWGITPENVARFEKIAGTRLDVSGWLQQFVLKREELEERLSKAPRGSREEAMLRYKLGVIMDDTAKLFGQKFSDTVGAMTSRDLTRLNENIRKAIPLGEVEGATRRAREFDISLHSLKATFGALRMGIGRDVQPSITSFLAALNQKLLDTSEGGQGLGRAFRGLASEMANKAWRALEDIMNRIDHRRVNAWIAAIQKWKPAETAETVKNLIVGVLQFGKAVATLITSVQEFIAAMPSWTKIKEQLKGPNVWDWLRKRGEGPTEAPTGGETAAGRVGGAFEALGGGGGGAPGEGAGRVGGAFEALGGGASGAPAAPAAPTAPTAAPPTPAPAPPPPPRAAAPPPPTPQPGPPGPAGAPPPMTVTPPTAQPTPTLQGMQVPPAAAPGGPPAEGPVTAAPRPGGPPAAGAAPAAPVQAATGAPPPMAVKPPAGTPTAPAPAAAAGGPPPPAPTVSATGGATPAPPEGPSAAAPGAAPVTQGPPAGPPIPSPTNPEPGKRGVFGTIRDWFKGKGAAGAPEPAPEGQAATGPPTPPPELGTTAAPGVPSAPAVSRGGISPEAVRAEPAVYRGELGGASPAMMQTLKGAAAGSAFSAMTDVERGPGGDAIVMKAGFKMPPTPEGSFPGAGALSAAGTAAGFLVPGALGGAIEATTHGALYGATGATYGDVLRETVPGMGMLSMMKRDAEQGHPMRTYLRGLLGIEDPGEPAPWQRGARDEKAEALSAPFSERYGDWKGGITAEDGSNFGTAAAESLRQGIHGLSIGGTPSTSYGVAPRSAPKNVGGDTPTEA